MSSDGVIFEVLVKVGRVCHIKDHEVPVPAQGLPLAPGASRTMVAAKDLVPGEWSREAPWHDAGYKVDGTIQFGARQRARSCAGLRARV